jgi:hypothetical protein
VCESVCVTRPSPVVVRRKGPGGTQSARCPCRCWGRGGVAERVAGGDVRPKRPAGPRGKACFRLSHRGRHDPSRGKGMLRSNVRIARCTTAGKCVGSGNSRFGNELQAVAETEVEANDHQRRPSSGTKPQRETMLGRSRQGFATRFPEPNGCRCTGQSHGCNRLPDNRIRGSG